MTMMMRLLRTILYKLGTSGLSFITGIVTAHLLTVAARGVYNSVGITLLLGSTFFEGYASFFNYGLNKVKLKLQTVVSSAVRIVLFILFGSLVLLAATLLLAVRHIYLVQMTFILGIFPLIVSYSYCSRLLQALNEIDLLNKLNLIQPLTFMVLSLMLFIKHLHGSEKWLTATLLMYFFSYLVAALCAALATKWKAQISLRPARNGQVSTMMVPYGNRTGLQNVLTQLNYRGDFYMVQWLAGWKSAGWYGNALSLSELLWQVSQSISVVVYSSIAKAEQHDSIMLTERTFRFSFWVLVVGGISMFSCSPMIPLLYGHKFAPSVHPYKILIIGTIAYGATGILAQFFRDQLGKVKYPLYMQAVCVASNVLACWVLIPHLGMIGGAIASSTAYCIALIMSVIYFKALTKRPLHHLFMFNAQDVVFLRRIRMRHSSQRNLTP